MCYADSVHPKITAEQREALSAARGGPVTVIVPVLMEKYMLLSVADYDRMVEFLVDSGVDLRRHAPRFAVPHFLNSASSLRRRRPL